MTFVAAVFVTLCSLWITLGLVVLVRTVRRTRAPRLRRLVPVSILKPLCGADAGLEANLASFFEQDYPNFELVFGVESETDPAIAVVVALGARYPQVRCRLVCHRGARAINPKVRNLRGMLPHARHDLLLVSDSNVRAAPNYVRDLVATLQADERAGLVTNLFAGTGANTVGAALENVQLNGFCAAGTTLPTRLGSAAVVGKSMLFSRETFERLGGFARVSDVLAEDFVMGKMFQHGGYRVRIAPTVLNQVTTGMSVRAFLSRHLRWAMLRWRVLPLAFALEPLTSPVAMLPLCWILLGPWALLWAATLLIARDVGGWLVLRGRRRAWLPALLAPLRDICVLGVWLRAPLKRHVTWRGHRVRVGAGTLLYASRPA